MNALRLDQAIAQLHRGSKARGDPSELDVPQETAGVPGVFVCGITRGLLWLDLTASNLCTSAPRPALSRWTTRLRSAYPPSTPASSRSSARVASPRSSPPHAARYRSPMRLSQSGRHARSGGGAGSFGVREGTAGRTGQVLAQASVVQRIAGPPRGIIGDVADRPKSVPHQPVNQRRITQPARGAQARRHPGVLRLPRERRAGRYEIPVPGSRGTAAGFHGRKRHPARSEARGDSGPRPDPGRSTPG